MCLCRKTDLKKRFHCSPNAISKFSRGNGVARSRLVTKWDLPLELFITGPLTIMVNKSGYSKPNKDGHAYKNADVCGRLLTPWGMACRVSKRNTALAINACPKGNADSPVLVFEKDGHLQFRHFDMPSYI